MIVVAMTAAGFPWIFVALWFVYAVPSPLPWGDALLAARFAAPTSAGILFSMLEAAGMKDTWLFRKARVLAIFDDLDTVLLMIPLKVVGGHRRVMATGLASGAVRKLWGDAPPSLAESPYHDEGTRILEEGNEDDLTVGQLTFHVLCVSLLMVLGKMFPICCYREEANIRTRLALALGMCPRGEVGAGVIVISISFGICGQCITIAVVCLALNLIASSFFILGVRQLLEYANIDDSKHGIVRDDITGRVRGDLGEGGEGGDEDQDKSGGGSGGGGGGDSKV